MTLVHFINGPKDGHRVEMTQRWTSWEVSRAPKTEMSVVAEAKRQPDEPERGVYERVGNLALWRGWR